MQDIAYMRSFVIDPTGLHAPKPILEYILYETRDDGTPIAVVITTYGDVLDVPLKNILPAHVIVAPAVTYAKSAVA